MTSTNNYRFGWRRDTPDGRDLLFTIPEDVAQSLPAQVDLTAQCPPVYDQGDLGSCTANAIAGAFEFDVLRQKLPDFTPSRLFIYYFERALEGDVSQDSGATLRDGMKVMNKRGVCPESLWPYDTSKFAVEPPVQCRVDALDHRVVSYRRITKNLTMMKACLASGLPFVFGINVFQSFMDANDGVVPMPGPDEPLLGGHAIVAVGFDDATQRFKFRNSWGESYGQNGYGTIPYAYLTSSQASDFWQISVVGNVLTQIVERLHI
jgi:C1A family cysteine protease